MKPLYVFVSREAVTSAHGLQGEGMSGIPHELEGYPIHHRPIVHAEADKMGLVEGLNPLGPTELEVEPGTVGLGMVVETLCGRSPRSRWEACCTPDDTARLWGRDRPAQVLNDAHVGRVVDRLDATGPVQICTAGAVRADLRCGFDQP